VELEEDEANEESGTWGRKTGERGSIPTFRTIL